MVVTAGTTDFGSIDPIEDIAKLAKKEQLWCHVDGAGRRRGIIGE
ncbi:hypothetical protein ACOBV8_18560 (plasmid) [Pseudoalteromonas espejiana]